MSEQTVYTSVIVVGIATILALACGHNISEGHIGVYYRSGALLTGTTTPGLNFMIPWITRVAEVQVTTQTDSVSGIQCGTKSGPIVIFDKIEIVNRLPEEHVLKTVKNYGLLYDKTLIFDNVHRLVNDFCSENNLQQVYIDKFAEMDDFIKTALKKSCDNFAPGLEIIDVRLSKPTIPQATMDQYVKLESSKAEARVAEEEAKVIAIRAEAMRKRDLIAAEASQEVARINRVIFSEQKKAESDAIAYAATTEAKANEMRLTPQFLEYQRYLAMTNSSKVYYFGTTMPTNFWVGERPVQ